MAEVSFQTGSLAEDFCALVRAKNMVVSFSTLSTHAGNGAVGPEKA